MPFCYDTDRWAVEPHDDIFGDRLAEEFWFDTSDALVRRLRPGAHALEQWFHARLDVSLAANACKPTHPEMRPSCSPMVSFFDVV